MTEPVDSERGIVDTAMPHASTIESHGRCVFCGLPSHDPGPCLKRPCQAVTDHADTIRRLEEAAQAAESLDRDHGWYQESEIRYLPPTWLTDIRFIALASPERILALLAERQQAIDDAAEWKEAFEAAVVQRKQAIDALRLGVKFEREYQRMRGAAWHPSAQMYLDKCQSEFNAAAALLSIGEQDDEGITPIETGPLL